MNRIRKKYVLPLFLASLTILFTFSACKKDKDAALGLDTHSIVFSGNQTQRYFSIVNTGDKSLNYTLSTNATYLSLEPTSGSLTFNQTARIRVEADVNSLSFGSHAAIIEVTSNGGTEQIQVVVQKPAPLPAELSWDVDYIKMPSVEDSTYIELKNIGETDLSFTLSSQHSFLSFSPATASLLPNATQKVWIKADKTALGDGLHAADFVINSNGGDANIQLDIEKNVYSITFFNPCYTPIAIHQPNGDTTVHEIALADRYNFVMPANPSSFSYKAETHGQSASNMMLGLNIMWDETLDVSQEVSPIYDLNISEDFFFMRVRNNGTYKLDKWSVNNGTQYQIDDDITIPNDGNIYDFGYYDALSNTKIFARLVGTNDDAYWAQGTHFTFPNTINQSVLLESSLKSKTSSQRALSKAGASLEQAKISPEKQTVLRYRSTKALVSKRRR